MPWSWSACWSTALKVNTPAAAAAEVIAVLLVADAVLLLAGLGSPVFHPASTPEDLAATVVTDPLVKLTFWCRRRWLMWFFSRVVMASYTETNRPTSVGTDIYPHMPTYVHTPRHIPRTAHLKRDVCGVPSLQGHRKFQFWNWKIPPPRSAKNSRKFSLSIKLNHHSLCNTNTLCTACIPYVVFMGRNVG